MLCLVTAMSIGSNREANERQSKNFGGGPAIPILKSVIGTAGNPKTTDPLWLEPCCFLLRVLLAYKTTNQ